MMKFMSLALSLLTVSPNQVTDVNGDSIEVTEEKVILDLSNDFSNTWNITDDQVMGGKSQSYIELVNNDYAKFSGTISSDGGGFCTTQSKELSPIDASQYDGIALTVSSDKNLIYKMALGDASGTRLWFMPWMTWEA